MLGCLGAPPRLADSGGVWHRQAALRAQNLTAMCRGATAVSAVGPRFPSSDERTAPNVAWHGRWLPPLNRANSRFLPSTLRSRQVACERPCLYPLPTAAIQRLRAASPSWSRQPAPRRSIIQAAVPPGGEQAGPRVSSAAAPYWRISPPKAKNANEGLPAPWPHPRSRLSRDKYRYELSSATNGSMSSKFSSPSPLRSPFDIGHPG